MNTLMERLQTWWAARLPSEQRILTLGGIALVLIIWIGLILLPLQSRVQRLNDELPELRETQASLMAMAREASTLSATPALTPLPPAQRVAAVQRLVATAALGEANNITVTQQDTAHIRVRCEDSDYGQWLAWLHSAREELNASVDSVTVSARPANGITGRVRAEVVFGFGDANPRPADEHTPSAPFCLDRPCHARDHGGVSACQLDRQAGRDPDRRGPDPG